MRIGICGNPEDGAMLAAAGFGYVELNVQRDLAPANDDEAYAERSAVVAACPLPTEHACCFLPDSPLCVGPDVDRSALLAYATTAFERAKCHGVRRIVFGSGDARNIPVGFDRDEARAQFVSLLKDLGPVAAPNGITIVIEPLNKGECNFVNSVIEGAELAREANHPNVRLLADFYHMLLENDTADDLRSVVDLVEHTHCAEKDERTPPGVKGDDFRPYLQVLAEANYAGAISIEARWGDLASEAGPAIAALRAQCTDVSLPMSIRPD